MKSEPPAKIETITPALAAEYLQHNTINRVPQRGRIRQIADEIEAGRWQLNGETIKFSVTGQLLDGQHRLFACVLAGRPIVSMVVRGLPEDAFPTIDTGKPRTAADTLSRVGIKHYAAVAAALAVVHRIERGKGWTAKVTNAEISELLTQHPGIHRSVDRYCKCAIMPGSTASSLHYLAHRRRPDLADEFWDRLLDGIGLRPGLPVYVLRNRLIQSITSNCRLLPEYTAAIAIKAWNSTVQGRTDVKVLHWVRDPNRPEEFPVIL